MKLECLFLSYLHLLRGAALSSGLFAIPVPFYSVDSTAAATTTAASPDGCWRLLEASPLNHFLEKSVGFRVRKDEGRGSGVFRELFSSDFFLSRMETPTCECFPLLRLLSNPRRQSYVAALAPILQAKVPDRSSGFFSPLDCVFPH